MALTNPLLILIRPIYLHSTPLHSQQETQLLLTCLMDAWVITELQYVEVSPLHAAPDAVDARDVRALVLHCKQGTHHLLIPVMLEF